MHPLFKYIYFPLAMGIFVMLKSCSNSDNINQYYKKVVKPTEEEYKLHKEYLKTSLKKNFF